MPDPSHDASDALRFKIYIILGYSFRSIAVRCRFRKQSQIVLENIIKSIFSYFFPLSSDSRKSTKMLKCLRLG